MKKLMAVLLVIVALTAPARADGFTGYVNGRIYGSVTVDVTGLTDYLALCDENDIIIRFKEVLVNRRDEDEWILCTVSDDMSIIYDVDYDGSEYWISLEVPSDYRPKDAASILLLAHMLSMEYDEAEALYENLRYNVIDHFCTIETDEYRLTYMEYSSGQALYISVIANRE